MNFSLSRRNAIHLTAAAAALPFLGRVSRADAQEVPLAIKGYDPVAYFTDGNAVTDNDTCENPLGRRGSAWPPSAYPSKI